MSLTTLYCPYFVHEHNFLQRRCSTRSQPCISVKCSFAHQQMLSAHDYPFLTRVFISCRDIVTFVVHHFNRSKLFLSKKDENHLRSSECKLYLNCSPIGYRVTVCLWYIPLSYTQSIKTLKHAGMYSHNELRIRNQSFQLSDYIFFQMNNDENTII